MDIQLRKSLRPHLLLQHAEEGSINSIINVNPNVLDSKEKEVIEVGNFYLPYSTGFEIECHYASNYNLENFTSIKNIIEVINDSGEQRYRIPSGIDGLKCLYDICFQLKLNSQITNSGIHYHVDCNDLVEKDFYDSDIISKYKELILNELDTWNYQGSYNKRETSWYRLNRSFGTIEFRIGEMSFDYNILLKRIVHINAIMRYIKNELFNQYILDRHPVLRYKEENSIEDILKSRTKKI